MTQQPVSPPLGTTADDGGYVRRLVVLFGLVYFAQGLCQHGGVVAQPLQFYFKEALGLDPAQTTEYLAVLTIPWTIKPLYGLVSDFFPLLGFRRKTWLLLTNLIAASGFLWLTGVTAPTAVVSALMLTAFGTAASDVIIDALMVESGKRSGETATFQSVQWLWISLASIVSALVGGLLCTVFVPAQALHIAAMISLAAPLAVAVASWLIVREDKAAINMVEMRATWSAVRETFRSRTLWAVIAFIAFWNFSPGFGTPWYYHQTDTLKFSQGFIGVISAVEAGGGVLGALAYWRYLARAPIKRQLSLGIWAGVIGTLLYITLVQPTPISKVIAVAVGILFGAAAMIATLSTLTLAAKACPPKSEGFTFAALMSLNNAVAQVAQIIGARLYTDWLNKSMLPLILISAAFTFACFLVLPILRGAHLDAGSESPR